MRWRSSRTVRAGNARRALWRRGRRRLLEPGSPYRVARRAPAGPPAGVLEWGRVYLGGVGLPAAALRRDVDAVLRYAAELFERGGVAVWVCIGDPAAGGRLEVPAGTP